PVPAALQVRVEEMDCSGSLRGGRGLAYHVLHVSVGAVHDGGGSILRESGRVRTERGRPRWRRRCPCRRECASCSRSSSLTASCRRRRTSCSPSTAIYHVCLPIPSSTFMSSLPVSIFVSIASVHSWQAAGADGRGLA